MARISGKALALLMCFAFFVGVGAYAIFRPPADDTTSHSVVPESVSDPDGYFLPNADTVRYTREELEKLSTKELYLARNEIFARHGRVYVQHEDLNDYFMSKNWYKPRYTYEEFNELNSRVKQLNAYEEYNVNVMLEIEKERNSPYLD